MNNLYKNNQNYKNKTVNVNVNKPKSPQKPATNDNKRNHSSSSNLDPSSPKILQHVHKKLFTTRNRFELLKPTKPPDKTFIEERKSIADQVPISSKPSPSIFIREDFAGVCTALIKLIDVNNFICKTTVVRLKIQTLNPEVYRSLVHYLRN